MVVPGLAMLAALPFIVLTLMAPSQPLMFGALFLAEALLFVNTGPCNAVIGNVVPPYLRATAYATAIFCLHFLGDIWSPWLIGAAADYAGRADTMATPLGSLLAWFGALPVQVAGQDRPENLTAGLLIVLPAVALSGVVLLAGSRHLPRETALMLARLRATAARVEPAAGPEAADA
jgi:hypothetical protein